MFDTMTNHDPAISPVPYKNHFFNEALDNLSEGLMDRDLCHRVSDLGVFAGISDPAVMEYAVTRALQVCTTAGIPHRPNFKHIFTCAGETVSSEWLLSDLAMRLVILNADPVNPVVARMQLQLTQTF